MVLEERGVATATICTEEFARLGQLEATALGMPWLPIVVVPHPVADLTQEQVWALAQQSLAEVIRVLNTPADDLMREFKDKEYPEPKRVFKPRAVFAR